MAIASGDADHTKPIPGDKGIRFKAIAPNLSEPIDLARLKIAGNTKKPKLCKKGWICGNSCISRNKKRCHKKPTAEQKQAIKYLKKAEHRRLAQMRGEKALQKSPQLIKAQKEMDDALAELTRLRRNFDGLSGRDLNPETAFIYRKLRDTDIPRAERAVKAAEKAIQRAKDEAGIKETFRPGKSLGMEEINRPLTASEVELVGVRYTIPDIRGYTRGSDGYDRIRAQQQAYQRAQQQAPGISVAEFKAIRNYTSGSGYIGPNGAARGLQENPNSQLARQQRAEARLVHQALGRLPAWQGTVRRDTQISADEFALYRPGEVIQLSGVTSTTRDLSGAATRNYGSQGSTGNIPQQAGRSRLAGSREQSKADRFAQEAQKAGIRVIPDSQSVRVEYRMNVRSGRDISLLSAAQKESEIALQHGWRGRVARVETYEDRGETVQRIYLDEVPDGVSLNEAIDLARLKIAGNTKQPKSCKKGQVCGFSCISKFNKDGSVRKCRKKPNTEQAAGAKYVKEKSKKQGNKMAAKKKNAEVEIRKPPEGHVLSSSDRLNADDLDGAIRSIGSPGINQRLNQLNEFSAIHEIKVNFTPYEADLIGSEDFNKDILFDKKRNAAVDAYRTAYPASRRKQFEENTILMRARIEKEHLISPEMAVSLTDEETVAVGLFSVGLAGPEGFTSRKYDHVVVRSTQENGTFGSVPQGKLDASAIRQGVQSSLRNAKEGNPDWSGLGDAIYEVEGANTADAETLFTYIHEMGHQVHYKAEAVARQRAGITNENEVFQLRPPAGVINPSEYGSLEDNYKEWFAESFAAYMVDANAYRAADPIGHDFIQQAFNDALQKP